MKTMHYAGSPGKGYGWGVFNSYMYRELDKHFVMVTSCHDPVDVCFMPVDCAFRPLTHARGKVNVCMNFFESPLEPCAKENAAKFDVVFVGSTWCQKRCEEAGIFNTRVLIQGVDGEIFKPQPPRAPDGTIRIFSGGKFEYRKGQDLVIAAFREFLKSHPNAHLVCSWFNPWTALISSMIHSPHLRNPCRSFDSQETYFAALLEGNGIPQGCFTILLQLSQQDLAAEMANTDFGVFPNRCEGGTNLVLMEYLSCHRPAAANLKTGHADLNEDADIVPIFCEEDTATQWADQTIPEITDAMERMVSHGILLGGKVPRWTWEAAAKTVIAEIDRLAT